MVSVASNDGSDGDGDRILRIGGVVLVVAVVAGVGVLVLAGANVPANQGNPPDAEFSIARVNDSYARVVHAGGEPVPASDVVVSVDGKIRQVTWSGAGDLVSKGDRVALRVQGGQTIRVWWEGPPGSRHLLVSERID